MDLRPWLEELGVRWDCIRGHVIPVMARGVRAHLNPACAHGEQPGMHSRWDLWSVKRIQMEGCRFCIDRYALKEALRKTAPVQAAIWYRSMTGLLRQCRSVAEAREMLAECVPPFEADTWLTESTLKRLRDAEEEAEQIVREADPAVVLMWARRFTLWSACATAPLPPHVTEDQAPGVDALFRRWATTDPMGYVGVRPPHMGRLPDGRGVEGELLAHWESIVAGNSRAAELVVIGATIPARSAATSAGRQAITSLHEHVGVGPTAVVVAGEVADLVAHLATQAGVTYARQPCQSPAGAEIAVRLLARNTDVVAVAELAAACSSNR